MKALVLDPEIVIPYETKTPHMGLIWRAFEEKRENRSLEALLAETRMAAEFKDWKELKTWMYAERCERNRRLYGMKNWEQGLGWRLVPPVPVVEAPADLRDLGQYVVYNGHNRRAAALKAKILLPCLLLEKEQDVDYLAYNGELPPGDTGLTLRELVMLTWNNARFVYRRNMK